MFFVFDVVDFEQVIGDCLVEVFYFGSNGFFVIFQEYVDMFYGIFNLVQKCWKVIGCFWDIEVIDNLGNYLLC